MSLVYMFVLLFYLDQADSLLVVNGTTPVRPGAENFEITCHYSVLPIGLTRMNSIELFRHETSGTKRIGHLWNEPGSPEIRLDGDLLNRETALISGSSSIVGPVLRITIETEFTRCSDAATYECRVNATISDVLFNDSAVGVLLLDVPVSDINVIEVSPYSSAESYEQYSYTAGTKILMTCRGSVGNPPRKHKWCRRGGHDTEWKLTAVLRKGDLTYDWRSCGFKRTSTFTYTVAEYDTVVQIICESGDSEPVCGSSPSIATVTLKNYAKTKKIRNDDYTKYPYQAAVLSGTSVALLICIGIIATIALLIKSRNQQLGNSDDLSLNYQSSSEYNNSVTRTNFREAQFVNSHYGEDQ